MLPHSRVLVADDDRDMRDAVAGVLQALGADVIRASSGGELIERMADEGPFDLLVTDISMPWMSGLQAVHAVRSAGLATPIIVMTAMKDERIPSQVEALGKNAVLLRKPFELDELEAAASKLLTSEPRS